MNTLIWMVVGFARLVVSLIRAYHWIGCWRTRHLQTYTPRQISAMIANLPYDPVTDKLGDPRAA